MTQTLVSAVVTTCKRKPDIIRRAVDSILSQTYSPIEIIVVDDSPADWPERDSVRDCLTCEYERINYIRHEKNQGACVARNTGLAAAKGEYIAYLDDDDEWLPQKIEKEMAAFRGEKTAMVYCGQRRFNDKNQSFRDINAKAVSGDAVKMLLLGNFVGSTSIPLIKTECLREIGGFDKLLKSAQDYDVWMRLAMKYEFRWVEEPLVIYHIHENEQISKSAANKIAGSEYLQVKYAELIEADRDASWAYPIKLAPYYSVAGDYAKAMELWKGAVKKCPEKLFKNSLYLYRILKNRK